jgi:murein L,D-transpeptidase YcbB/YkuD
VFAAIVTASIAAQERFGETDAQRDLRRFYRLMSDRAVWIDAHGHPTDGALRALYRLQHAESDGLAPEDYSAADLDRQATALRQAQTLSPMDAAAFDIGLTAGALRYFRDIHLGRIDPRDLGFHLDHAMEPHDFPEHLRSALEPDSFDRVVAGLRPAFAQYRGLKDALAAYRESAPARARQIELAMERLRWLPDVSGERLVVVNIPMFYLWGWEPNRDGGVPAIGMAAIIGRAGASKTPIFTSVITSVVLNPDWSVPESILRNEILPALAADPGYLVRNHMEMIDRGSGPRVRQLPGPWNALGPIKFGLPNLHDVYLHGTPAPELFTRVRRDFSHGCVRVEDPVALALWVLQGEQEWNRDRIRAVIDRGSTRSIKVSRPPRIVLFYLTAALMPEDGAVRFADDIYGHDARLQAALRTREERGGR